MNPPAVSESFAALSRIQIWMLAIRPKTLTASVAPVLMGAAMAWAAGALHWPSMLGALFGALCIQIGTNLANDYFDFKKGADTSERLGPVRVTQAGLISPAAVRNATILVFGLAALIWIGLIIRGGWPLFVIGSVSILCGILYTAGPFPLAYVGLGDLFVLIFFGPVAVGGTYYLQTLDIVYPVILAGLAPGFLSTAILAVNNLRDVDQDANAGKKTLAVRWGRGFAKGEYLFCILMAAVIPWIIFCSGTRHAYSLIASLFLVVAVPSLRAVFGRRDGPALNSALAHTGKLVLLFSLLFSAGWVLSP